MFGSIAEAGTRTSSNTTSEVTAARRLHLSMMRGVDTPGRSVSTKKPRTSPSSSLAQTRATSAMEAFVLQRLWPVIT